MPSHKMISFGVFRGLVGGRNSATMSFVNRVLNMSVHIADCGRAPGECVPNPEFYPMLRVLEFREFARPIYDGGNHFLQRCRLAQTVFGWSVLSRTRPGRAVSAVRHPALR